MGELFCFPLETAGRLNCRLVSPAMDAQVMYGRQVSLHTMGKKIKGEKKERRKKEGNFFHEREELYPMGSSEG